MIMNSWFSPDGSDLYATLEAGLGPVVVLDPCGELWTQFLLEDRWRLWRVWRLMPGQAGDFDGWDVLGEIQGVNAAAGASVLAAALFPLTQNTELTRRLMSCVLAFANDTGHFMGLPALAGQLWADDLWPVIARWSRLFPYHPALQKARELLTLEGAGEAMMAIRHRMMTYHHPHVAETFQAGMGFCLSRLRLQPGQILFLTPSIRCLENVDLMAVYTFITESLLQLSALHYQPLTLFQPKFPFEGVAS